MICAICLRRRRREDVRTYRCGLGRTWIVCDACARDLRAAYGQRAIEEVFSARVRNSGVESRHRVGPTSTARASGRPQSTRQP